MQERFVRGVFVHPIILVCFEIKYYLTQHSISSSSKDDTNRVNDTTVVK